MIYKKTFSKLDRHELLMILKLRQEVFMLEQKIYVLDIDEIEEKAWHYFIKDNHEVISYARVYIEQGETHVGRIVTKKEYRNKGLSTMILQKIMREYPTLVISSQLPVCDFYAKLGFSKVGEVYLEAGIFHQKMVYPSKK